jgi:hypothetical protein
MSYAGFVVIMGRGSQDFEEVFTTLFEEGNKICLEINGKRQNLRLFQENLTNKNERVKLLSSSFEIVKDRGRLWYNSNKKMN